MATSSPTATAIYSGVSGTSLKQRGSPSVAAVETTPAKSHGRELPPVDEKEAEQLYTPWRLAFYDWWVLGVVSTYAWGCSTSKYLLPLFRNNVGKNHLDVGVGTGYYTDPSSVPASTRLTLVDSEQHALDVARVRSKRPDATAVVANVLKPLPLTEKYDSVSMYYLLHCIDAPLSEKCRVFSLIKDHMTSDGVLTGSNVLGKGVRDDNFFGAFIRRSITEHGILKNKEDHAYFYERALRECFHEVETKVVGSVFIFKAAKPKLN